MTDGPIRLALAQIELEAGTVEANVDRAVAAVERAAAGGADLVVLPEMFTVGYFAFDQYTRAAESLEGETLSRLSALAADLGVVIQAGSIVEDLAESAADGITVPESDGLANASVLFDRSGKRRLVYRKHHLFGYGSAEQRLLTPGESLATAEVGSFTVAVTTCYDLRFPELYRDLLDRGADLLLVPSAWPYPRVEHWQTLPRARAIENLSYVAVVNGSGTMGEDRLVGRSTVFDPWGTPVVSSGDEPALVTADVDPSRLAEVREDFPALRDRRV